jgi:hypothetical protein
MTLQLKLDGGVAEPQPFASTYLSRAIHACQCGVWDELREGTSLQEDQLTCDQCDDLICLSCESRYADDNGGFIPSTHDLGKCQQCRRRLCRICWEGHHSSVLPENWRDYEHLCHECLKPRISVCARCPDRYLCSDVAKNIQHGLRPCAECGGLCWMCSEEEMEGRDVTSLAFYLFGVGSRPWMARSCQDNVYARSVKVLRGTFGEEEYIVEPSEDDLDQSAADEDRFRWVDVFCTSRCFSKYFFFLGEACSILATQASLCALMIARYYPRSHLGWLPRDVLVLVCRSVFHSRNDIALWRPLAEEVTEALGRQRAKKCPLPDIVSQAARSPLLKSWQCASCVAVPSRLCNLGQCFKCCLLIRLENPEIECAFHCPRQ